MIRMSVASLLRAKNDNGSLILVANDRGVLGPLGGACGYRPAADDVLSGMGWQPERPAVAGLTDLRGLLPDRSLDEFLEWLATGQHRESGEEGLRREITEELHEVGHGKLATMVSGAELAHAGQRTEPPAPLIDSPHRQTRRFDLYDLMPGNLLNQLGQLAADPAELKIVAVTADEAARSHIGKFQIGTQVRYLLPRDGGSR
jgi:hypothetical protein